MSQRNVPPEMKEWMARRACLVASRRTVRPLGWALVAHEALQVLLVIALGPLLLALFPAENAEMNRRAALNVALPILSLAPLFVYARRAGVTLKPDAGAETVTPGGFAVMLGAALGISALATLPLQLTENLFNAVGYSVLIDDIIPAESGAARAVMIAYAVLLAPLIEEYIYRGVVLGALRPCGDHFAVLASAMLFGLAHGNLYQLLYAALAGYFLGYVRVKTGRWSVCVLLHAANNLCAQLMEMIPMPVGEAAALTVSLIEWAVLCAVGVACLAAVYRRRGGLDASADTATPGSLLNLPFLLLLWYALFNIVMALKPLT